MPHRPDSRKAERLAAYHELIDRLGRIPNGRELETRWLVTPARRAAVALELRIQVARSPRTLPAGQVVKGRSKSR